MTVKEAREYKKSLYSALSRDLSDFEKNFLLIAAGVLTFSITFIKDIVKVDQSDFLFLLFTGWILFASSVGIMMFTFLKSAYSSDEIWDSVEEFMKSKKKTEDTDAFSQEESIEMRDKANQIAKKRKQELKSMRNWAIRCFLSGFLSFGIFVAVNLFKEQSITKSKQNEKTISFPLNNVKVIVTDSTVILKNK